MYLRDQLLWGNDDPLFPATKVEIGVQNQFESNGLKREHWKTASPIRGIFKQAFESVGLRYFNPHSFRNTLARFGEQTCTTPEQFKAWSQNLGHDNVMTTFISYGEVSQSRQAEILQTISRSDTGEQDELIQSISKAIHEHKAR